MNAAERQAAVDRLLDDRVAQGVPRQVEDPATIERVAAIVRGAVGSRVAA